MVPKESPDLRRYYGFSKLLRKTYYVLGTEDRAAYKTDPAPVPVPVLGERPVYKGRLTLNQPVQGCSALPWRGPEATRVSNRGT